MVDRQIDRLQISDLYHFILETKNGESQEEKWKQRQ